MPYSTDDNLPDFDIQFDEEDINGMIGPDDDDEDEETDDAYADWGMDNDNDEYYSDHLDHHYQ